MPTLHGRRCSVIITTELLASTFGERGTESGTGEGFVCSLTEPASEPGPVSPLRPCLRHDLPSLRTGVTTQTPPFSLKGPSRPHTLKVRRGVRSDLLSLEEGRR